MHRIAAIALSHLHDHADPAQRAVYQRALGTAQAFLLHTQSPDGFWPAAWGVNRIYGTLFAVRGLLASGLPRTHPSLTKTAWWLENIQLPYGGWAEHHSGCSTNTYVPGPTSQPASTAWALLALLSLRVALRRPPTHAGWCWKSVRGFYDQRRPPWTVGAGRLWASGGTNNSPFKDPAWPASATPVIEHAR
ncbi:hypothetical protein [Streptomyces sp. Je 1-369]|uniref:hypothetical protein n=1 Tax=Streptomyces sp. Je 1-369 TaxID=2966192 RepID=UPI0039DF5B3C